MTQVPTPTEEVQAVGWVHERVREGGALPLAELEVTATAIFAALRAAPLNILPRVPLTNMDDYPAVHAVNVAGLAMALAQQVQFDDATARRIGLTALLYDIGMALIPLELLAKPGQISAEERERVTQHPVQGARLILNADAMLDEAAIVAYEHHIKTDGSGYPELTYRRPTHYLTRLIQLCDIYHALRSPRPFRPAWPAEIVSSFLTERAGFEFHPALSSSLTAMMRQYEGNGEWTD